MADIQSKTGLNTYRSGQRKKRVRKGIPGTCGQSATRKDDKGEKQDLILLKKGILIAPR